MSLIKIGFKGLLPAHTAYIQSVLSEMKKNGQTNLNDFYHLMMYPNLFFIFAVDGDTPVGLLACSVQTQTSNCFVLVAYVNPDHRKKGIFASMLNEVRKGEPNPQFSWNKITFGVMVTNKIMQQVMRASGASPESTMYTIPLA